MPKEPPLSLSSESELNAAAPLSRATPTEGTLSFVRKGGFPSPIAEATFFFLKKRTLTPLPCSIKDS